MALNPIAVTERVVGDFSAAPLSNKAFCRTVAPKGCWRLDKAQDPELRHTVLSLDAFGTGK